MKIWRNSTRCSECESFECLSSEPTDVKGFIIPTKRKGRSLNLLLVDGKRSNRVQAERQEI